MANYYLDENGRITTQNTTKKRNQRKKGKSYILGDDGRIKEVETLGGEEDIAPVRETAKKKEKEDDSKLDFFQKGLFDDGYDAGDITKTILGTAGDIGLGLVKGVAKIGEGAGKAIATGVAGVADKIGQDEYAARVRKNLKESAIDNLTEGASDYLDDRSVLGRTSKSIVEGVGQVGGILATGGMGAAAGFGTAGVTALTTGVTGVSSFGHGVGEAYKGGAKEGEAELYGLIAGAADAGTELLFGGLGKAVKAKGLSTGILNIDDALAKKVSSLFSNQIAKNLTEYGIKSSAEGAEEVLAGVIQAVGKKVTYMSDEELTDILEDENLLEQFVVGAVTSGIAQAPSLVQSTQQGRDFVTGRTENEEAVISKEVEKRIEKAKAEGKTLSKKEEAAIAEQVEKDMEKGRISTDTIEEVLGGEAYERYKKVSDMEDSLSKEEEAAREEFNTLNRMKKGDMTGEQTDRLEELRTKLTDISSRREKMTQDHVKDNLKKNLSDEVSAFVKNDRLIESYNEKARRSQAFEADLEAYSPEQRKVVEKAVKSGILNNTNRTHEFVDIVAKISADKGVLFDFTNNERLKASGFSVEGATVNGYITKDGIAINMDSPKAWQSTVGHEITHVLEGTEVYTELQSALFEYAKAKKDYQGRYDTLAKLYKGKNVEAELTADLVGDYLFTDEAFVNSLSTKHRNVFQKIYDEIKYLAKIVTAGSKEARQLEKVKRAFDKAYRAQGNTQDGSIAREKTEASISKASEQKTEPVEVSLTKEQQAYFKDSVVRDENGNLKVMYHGTSQGGHTMFDPYGKARYGLFGAGSYFTDSKAIAESYTKKGKGNQPQVYETYLNITNPIDMDAPAVPAEWKRAMPDVDFPKSGTNEEFYRVMEEYFEGNEYPRWEAAETAMEVIEGMGYDGITHIGGGRVNADGERHQVYIAFRPEQIKNIDNAKPTSDPDIRYSLGESGAKEVNDTLKDVGLQYDANNEVVSYSLSSLEDTFDYKTDGDGMLLEEDDYIKAREEYVDALAKSIAEVKGKPTAEEVAKANRYLDSLFLIHDMIAADKDRLDYEAAVGKSAWVSNAEYGGSIDFSTLCAKRRLFTGTFDAIQEALPDTVLNENDFLQIRKMLLDKNLESPCSMCYVEGSRANHGKYVSKFLKDYLATNPKWKPQIADFTSTSRLEQTRINHPEAYEAYTKAMNSLAQRKPKEASVRTDYKGDILEAFKDGASVEAKNTNGGIRFNSFSDFEIIHTLDAMQVITDMARVGLNGQAYTKVKEFAEAFGNTGLKINLSLVAKDVDADGRLVFDEVNGMNHADAMDIRGRYSENVGTVLVVFNEAQLKAALADNSIDYVLPFHRSQWKKSQYTMMGLPTQTKDFTMVQNDRTTNPKTGKPVKLAKLKQTATYTNDITGETFEIKDNIMPNQYWDFSKSGRENAQRYLDYINENGMTPKFDSVLEKADGKWVLPEGAVGDGYFKLLIDFKMYDNNGWGSPQTPVVPEFNMPYIQEMLKSYTGGHKSFPVAHDVVNEFVNGKKNGKFSLSEDGIAPVRRGSFATPASDLRLEAAPVREDIAPAQETAQEAPVKETAATTQADEYAPISVTEANALQEESLASLGDADAPPEVDTPYYGESEDMAPDDPFEDRDIKEVGSRKVKAYMYENPEVKPFFQDEAKIMLGELERTIKGEKIYTEGDFGGYGGDSYYRWTGTKRQTSEDIAYLLDEHGYTYAEIEKGLKAIIEDDGKENNAVSKRIEFLLNDRLLKGYQDDTYGLAIPANQDYVNLLNEKQIAEYNEEAQKRLFGTADANAPAEDIDPVREKVAPPAAKEPVYPPMVKNADGIRMDFDKGEVMTGESKRPDPAGAENAVYPPVTENAGEMRIDFDKGNVVETKQEPTVTRKALHESIMIEIKSAFRKAGFDFDKVLQKAKNLSTFATVDNTPQRVMDKSLGYEAGHILSDLTVNKVAQNETEGIRWLNSFTDPKNGLLAKISKEYGIKPGSKKSAAAQMYAEGFYVDGDNNIVAYGDKELAADFPNILDQINIKRLANDQRIRKIYDDTLEAINASRRRNAYPEIHRLDNYFLHFRAMEDTFSRLGLPFNPNDIRAKDLPTDLNGVTADLKPGQPYFASAKHRMGKRTSFDLLGGLEKYLSSAKNQIYHIDDIQTLRALRNYIADTFGQAHGLENLDSLSDEEAEARIKEVFGAHLSTFAKFLNEEANVIAGKTSLVDRGIEGIIGRRGIATLDTINRQVGANMVGLNLSSSLTNFLSVVQATAKSNKLDVVKAYAQTVANRVGSLFGKGDGFADASPVMVRRKGIAQFHRTPWQKASDGGYVLMSAVDGISTELIARMKFNELTRKGVSEQEAHIETDKWVSRLMGDRSLGQQPQLFNSKMLGLVTKFQLEVRNQLDSQFYDTFQETKASTKDIENGLARNAIRAAKITATMVELAVLQHVFGKAFEAVAGYNPAFDIVDAIIKAFGFDDEEDDEDTALDNIEEGFLSLLGDLPYTSTFTGGRMPIESALPVEQFFTGKDKYGNEKNRLETLAEAAPYYILPGGYSQIKKTVQGLGMFDDEHPVSGSYTKSGNLRFPVEDTPLNRAQAALFGQWASGNARDYFDNERSPLKKNQIEEFMSSGMKIQDYWDYREGLSDHDKLEDKADYINSLDVPIGTKNLLINNQTDRKTPIDMTDYDLYASLEEFDFANDNPERYDFFIENGITYEDYKAADEKGKKAYTWAYENPEKFKVAKLIENDVVQFRKYTSEIAALESDKDEDGDPISGSVKAKAARYIDNLNIDYGQKLIFFKFQYKKDDTYNYEILDYLYNKDDVSYEDKVAILKELGFTVSADGNVTW